MRLAHDPHRCTVAIPRLGIVLKFARFNLPVAWRRVRLCLRLGGFRRLLNELWDERGLIFPHLLAGLRLNCRERRYYRHRRHCLLVPTTLSVFGFVNVQRLTRPIAMDPDDLLAHLQDLTDGAVDGDVQHFGDPDRYGHDRGAFRIRDYGSPTVQSVLDRYANRIHHDFNPRFRRPPAPTETQTDAIAASTD